MSEGGRVTIPEVDVDPLDDLMLDFLIERDREDASVDFKETLSISKDSPFAKIAKDIFAFANYGGGFILIGFPERQKSTTPQVGTITQRAFLVTGLPEEFHIDEADLQTKFNAYSDSPIPLRYHEFHRMIEHAQRKFAALYIPPSVTILKPTRDGDYTDRRGPHKAFIQGSVLFRRGTQSIPASKEELAWIKRRIEKTNYRISLLSGQPDQIQEPLYSNLFEVTKLPDAIWIATTKPANDEDSGQLAPIPNTVVFVPWGGKLVTFNDISEPSSPLWGMIEPQSVQKEELAAWLNDPDKERVVIRLLNKEILFLAKRIGLLDEPKKQKFYYGCDGEFRTETWTPRFRRSSTLKVAQRIYAQQLRRYIFWHLAVVARFTSLDGNLYMRLTPTLQLTDNGRKAIFGEKEGTVITRLTYNRYNSSYLNSLLFWISRLSQENEAISLAQGAIHVSAEPAECRVNVGIMSDRPVAEPVLESPEVEVEGDTDA